MEYLTLKWIHVLSSTVLFGTGIGSAYYLLAATLTRDARSTARVAGLVVRADWLFTATTAVLQPLTGWWMLHRLQMPWSTPWVAASVGCYVAAIACWLPVVWMQMRMHRLAREAAALGAPLPRRYWRLFALWVLLGAVAFVLFLLIFWMMVTRQVPWAPAGGV
ncbi:DUF2269 family protein [Pseudacidovorax intermedius]|uniref:DUF2269 family protein n=1 Tax=Pseudacidovorax intermedius TaxID=433924 RepID=UPI000348873D|nr:DUF2269 domain-containing protein [Pseudacidovorax intermedius]